MVYDLFMCCVLIFNDDFITKKIVSFCNSVVSDYLSFFSKFAISVSSIICLLFIKEYIINQKINRYEKEYFNSMCGTYNLKLNSLWLY